MKPDWDNSSPELADNLERVLDLAARHAADRRPVSVALMRDWHAAIMADLELPDPAWAGCFRGEGAAHDIGVRIGEHRGVAPGDVAAALAEFETRLVGAVATLDAAVAADGVDSVDELRAVIDLCAWAHGEWVRIHPFANGCGRTARMWVNYLAMRYGLQSFVRLRPRPDGGYAAAARSSMRGDWKAMVPVFLAMLDDTPTK